MGHQIILLILQLSVLVVAARLSGWLFSRYLRLPRVLGELAAGMIAGPYALGALSIPALGGPLFPPGEGLLPVSTELYGFAVFASIVLLFFSGLETDLPTFLRFSGRGSLVGLGGVIFSFVLGSATAVVFMRDVNSFTHPTALFLGTLSTATSIGITARILSEKRKLSTPEGVTILAAAVFDDVAGIILLAVVVGYARVAAGGGEVAWGGIALVAAKAVGFWLASTLLGILLAPRISRRLKKLESNETIVAVCFGLALFLSGLSEMAGLAMIIGAYVVGLSLSRTDIALEIRERMHGLHDFMVPIFFAVMGMMVNFSALRPVLAFGAVFSVMAFIGKILGCGLPALALGFNYQGAFRVGAGMLPRGEVTLIVAGVGLSTGAIGQETFGVAIMTLLAASLAAPPILVKSFSSGGEGYRGESGKGDGAVSVELEFPSPRMCSFVFAEVVSAFRSEGFFARQVDRSGELYNLRNDDMNVTIQMRGPVTVITTDPEHETFVRLLLIEVLLELKEFVQSVEVMKNPDMMGAELLKGVLGKPAP